MDLAVADFGLLFWPLLLEVEWRGEMVRFVRELLVKGEEGKGR